MDYVSALLGRNGYLPHGYCFTWTGSVLWSMVTADAVIAASYFSIPVAIVSFFRKRSDVSLNGLAMLFSAFIFACGITHLMDIWTIWQPDYGLQALTKIGTAAISLTTAVAMWLLIPGALKIPSVQRLQAANAALEEEVRQRRNAEQSLQESQQNLAMALASIGAGFIATDREGRVVLMNALSERVTGWTRAEATGTVVWDVFNRKGRPPEYASRNPVDVMLELGIGLNDVHHVFAVARDGSETELELKFSPTYADDGTVRGMALVFRDMTEQSRAAAESSKLAAIVASSADAIIGKTLQGDVTSWNAAAEAMFGYTAQEMIGQPVSLLIPPTRMPEEARILADLATDTVTPPFETVRRTKDGTLIEVSVTVSPVRDGQGRVVGASKIARDITHLRGAERALREAQAQVEAQRVQREAELTQSLREKDVLLKEIHHRVKNNLQIISSLLRLQATYQSDEVRQVFEDSQNRIRSMALVHEKLYKSKDMAEIDFADYVRDMVAGVAGAVRGNGGAVAVGVHAEPMELDVDRAISCGLVINELITNSFKHGFPPGRAGYIAVRLTGGGKAPIQLSVTDNGVGWPASFDPTTTSSLGLRLVHILAEQMHADLQLDGSQGMRCVLTLQP